MATRRARLNIRPNVGARNKANKLNTETSATVNDESENKDNDIQKETTETIIQKDPVVNDERANVEQSVETNTGNLNDTGTKDCAYDKTVSTHYDEIDNLQSSKSGETQVLQTTTNSTISKIEERTKSSNKDSIINDKAPVRQRSRFPKARPNLKVDVNRTRARHPSLGTSDSEDELRRHPPPVQRLVTTTKHPPSVQKTAATPSGQSTTCSTSNNEDPFIPPTVATTTIKASRTEKVDNAKEIGSIVEISNNPRSEPVTKSVVKRRKIERSDEPPDKGKMIMKDLIYWNPTSNPMTAIDDKKKKPNPEVLNESAMSGRQSPVSGRQSPVAEDEAAEAMPVPQLTIGPDGNIILNEESLVIDSSPTKVVYNSDSDVIHETEARITSASFRKRTCTRNWTKKETARFFKALSCVGTDFSMMSNLFPKRTRAELKNKFKKEERSSKHLVDKAIMERITFDLSLFESPESETENREQAKTKKVKGKKGMAKKPKVSKPVDTSTAKRKSKKKTLYEASDSDEDKQADLDAQDRYKTIERPDSGSDEDDEDSVIFGDSFNQPTRSGRVPKPVEFLRTDRSITKKPIKVSINGQPVVSTSINQSIRLPKPQVGTPVTGRFVNLPHSGQSGQISVNQLSPGQLIFVQSPQTNQPGSPQVLHVYVVSPTGMLDRTPPAGNIESPKRQPVSLLKKSPIQSQLASNEGNFNPRVNQVISNLSTEQILQEMNKGVIVPENEPVEINEELVELVESVAQS